MPTCGSGRFVTKQLLPVVNVRPTALPLAFPLPCHHHVLQAATMPASRSMLSTPSSATSLVE